MFDLLESYGVLFKVVWIKLNKLIEMDKLLFKEFCMVGNEYLRFILFEGIGGYKEEEISVYRKNIINKNMDSLLD